MTQQQRDAVEGILRASPFDPAGDLREQRPLFEKMVTAAPVIYVDIPGTTTDGVILYFHGGSSPSARQRPRSALPPTWLARRACGCPPGRFLARVLGRDHRRPAELAAEYHPERQAPRPRAQLATLCDLRAYRTLRRAALARAVW
jgi:hypothetical protein